MKRILLPTVDYTPQRGGVARYLQAIKDTLGDQVEILYWQDNPPRGLRLIVEILKASRGFDEIWTSHIFPIGIQYTNKWTSVADFENAMNFNVLNYRK